MHHSDDKLIIEDAPRKVDLAAKGLEAVAEAKRAQTAQEDKKKHIEQDFKDREKAKLRAALTKLAGGGINQGDLSAIIAELEGVYGSAEVALRQATELATKKRLS